MGRLIAVLFVGTLVLPRLVSGQSLEPGARVRVSLPGADTRTGTIVALTRDTLAVRLADSTQLVRLPFDRITRLEVSRGMQSRTRHVKKGMVIGASLGALGGFIAPCDGGEHPTCLSPLGGAIIGMVGGGAEGALVGLLVGVHRSEKWEWVPLEWRHVSLATPAASHGRGLGLRISF